MAGDSGEIDQQLTERFKARMDDLGLTQATMGSRIGKSQTYINNLFRGVKAYSPADMHSIAKALDVRIEDLVKKRLAAGENSAATPVQETLRHPENLGTAYAFACRWYSDRGRYKTPIELGQIAARMLMYVESKEPDFEQKLERPASRDLLLMKALLEAVT